VSANSIQPGSAPSAGSNLLGSTLFFAALVHGVIILGISFTAGISTRPDDPPSLKVTLLTESSTFEPLPDHSEYLANRNQHEAGGAVDGTRPTTAVSALEMLSVDGDQQGADLEDSVPQERLQTAGELVTQREMDRAVNADPDAAESVSDMPKRAAAMIDVRADQSLATEIDQQAQLPDSEPDGFVASPSARASAIAAYLDGWRQRVERIGTLNFPDQFLAGNTATRKPTLAVVIAADGTLQDIVVQNSSGDRAVDQAALTILRMAAPFDPLPDSLSGDYEQLRFAYEWDFIRGVGEPESE